MVIQRWQTVWLLVAAVIMCVFCAVPMALINNDASPDSITAVYPTDMPVLLAVAVAVILLTVIDIFLYKNMRRQKLVARVSMLLIAVTALVECLTIYCNPASAAADLHVQWFGSIFLLVGAFAFIWLAYRGIVSDEKLLKAADRLR